MADLQALQDFAAEHGFGLTRPLTHRQVELLAKYWQPEMRFHVDERFHPISLDQRIDMVTSLFAQIPAAEQERWRVSKVIRTGAVTDPTGAVRTFDPPIVHVPDGSVSVAEDEGISPSDPAVRVLNDGSPARPAFEDPAVDEDAVFTQGAAAVRARKFFRAQTNKAGETVGTAGDGLLPRAGNITTMAAYKNLLDLLKYELLVEEAPGYPPDGLRGGFDIAGSLFDGPFPLPAGIRRQVLLDLIAAYEAGDLSADTPGLPSGWTLNGKVWDGVTRYAFLEYDFFYAYNDWERYQVAVWDNEHEGDDEGCCLVFDRNLIDLAAASGDDDQLRRAVPHCIITCVHEELQDADLFDFIPTPVPPDDIANWLPRQDMDLVVYIAGGSHATYLTNGTNGKHDLVDFGDFWAYPEDIGGPVLAAHLLPALILAALFEKLQDTEDFTSDDGIRTGPPEVIGENPAGSPNNLIVIPMSAGNHIYQPRHAELLRLRAFPGKWGGHDGIIDHSGPLEVKTGRYFRKLLRNL